MVQAEFLLYLMKGKIKSWYITEFLSFLLSSQNTLHFKKNAVYNELQISLSYLKMNAL